MSTTRKIRGGAPRSTRSKRTRTRHKQLANRPRHTRNHHVVQNIMNRRSRTAPTSENMLMAMVKSQVAPKNKLGRKIRKEAIKKLLKRAARGTDDPFNTLNEMSIFLIKAIDMYNELQEDEVNDEEQATITTDILNEIFLMLRKDIEDFADDPDNDITELGDYNELKRANNGREHFLDEGLVEYMQLFQTYLTDVLKDFKKHPSEDKFQILNKLQKIIQRVLREYVKENHGKDDSPSNITNKLDKLLGSMKL